DTVDTMATIVENKNITGIILGATKNTIPMAILKENTNITGINLGINLGTIKNIMTMTMDIPHRYI
ncbi:hypothetical protein BpHYR1_018977, partial [Brachionus plicatilis]